MIRQTDARQSPDNLWFRWHCYKLRLADGVATVVTREWWIDFLRQLDPETVAIEDEKATQRYLAACERAGVQ
jgi:hypothetical protein